MNKRKGIDVDQKLDYAPLIADAMKKQGMTRYAVAKALGYKQISTIYLVEKGEAGMSAAKLTKLLQLAGKLALLVALSALLYSAQVPDAQAEVVGPDRQLCIM